jgi:hypothetical protein
VIAKKMTIVEIIKPLSRAAEVIYYSRVSE